jgi:predicted Zn finger-like uncharacterized protein
MLIVCPCCATSYDVGLASLSPDGGQVRCARCRTVWHAELNHSEKLVAAAAAIAPHDDMAERATGSVETPGLSSEAEAFGAISSNAPAPHSVELAAIEDSSSGTQVESASADRAVAQYAAARGNCIVPCAPRLAAAGRPRSGSSLHDPARFRFRTPLTSWPEFS